jgi:anthranilate synthase component 2
VQFADEVVVCRNNAVDLERIAQFDKIVLSPGPGLPSEKENLMEIIRVYHTNKPILGVCLGLQALYEFFGGRLVNLNSVMHGIQSHCERINDDYLFKNIPARFKIGHYHSWIADTKYVPGNLEVIAVNDKKHCMAIKHKSLDIRAVQFHPESVLTEHGLKMIQNWVGKM